MKIAKGLILTTVLVTGAVARAQPAPGDPARPGSDAGARPLALDRAAAATGMQLVRRDVESCEPHGFAGQLKAVVRVAADGSVAEVTIKDVPPELASCIEAAVRRARFVATTNGGAFAYPFAFGTVGVSSEPVPADDDRSGAEELPVDPYGTAAARPAAPTVRRPPDPTIDMPEVLTTPTGWLLPAAVLYSKTSIDTGGGVTSDTRVGLGDVAEFGVATTDAVRERDDDGDAASSRIQPYLTASFRLGVSEGRLFEEQPGITLGFRKSFERNHDGFKTRIAELTLVASKKIGKRTALHLGGAFWDASLEGRLDGDTLDRREVTFHGGNNYGRQIRAFGGIEVHPLAKSQILIDLGWSPEFCYRCTTDEDKIRLRPTLSWGVRYEVADWMHLESGVRVPDIGSANLLDAQIFGQVTFTSWALRHAVDSLK